MVHVHMSADERGCNPMHTRPQHVMRPLRGWTRVHGGMQWWPDYTMCLGSQLNQQYSRWLVSETDVRTPQCCTVQTGHAQNEGTDHGTTAPASGSYAWITLKPRCLGWRLRAGCVSPKMKPLTHLCAQTASCKYTWKDCACDMPLDACVRVI